MIVALEPLLGWVAVGICLLVAAAAAVRGGGAPGWVLVAGMLLLALERVVDRGGGFWALVLEALLPAVWLGFGGLFARGARVHRGWLAPLFAGALPLGMLVAAPEVMLDAGTRLAPAGKWWVLWVLVASLWVIATLERTLRSAVGIVRWRIKYLVLGVATIFGVKAYVLSQWLLFSGEPPPLAMLENFGVIIGASMVGLAQLRCAISGIEIYPSRALLHGSLTLILAGAYFLGVGLLAQAVAVLGLAGNFPAQALVLLLGLVGITVLLLSERVRSGGRRLVSRHLRRGEHDFREIWAEFTRRTTSVLDARQLGVNAAEMLAATFHVLGVTVCRVGAGGRELDCLHSTADRRAGETLVLGDGLAAGLGVRPVVLERAVGGWAEGLRRWCPRKFAHGGERLVVPLAAGGELVGLVVLSDRVNGTAYSDEEHDLLGCLGDQLAGALRTCALSEEVMQARQWETFQTLAAFFVHDLKNAASSLGLMLGNLPRHFDDPEFRADAVRTTSRAVERINQMLARLGSLGGELELGVAACRLDALCGEVLAADGSAGVRAELRRVPEQLLDGEAIKSVVRNLLGNAREAIGPDGTIELATRTEGGGVVLVVGDDGCGMSAEFVRESLFRPFRTTKSNGLGIGMFQCRKIIDAHGGSIRVESEPQHGTRFTVFLPLVSRHAHARHQAKGAHR
jgi:signal transduction histidine kinase